MIVILIVVALLTYLFYAINKWYLYWQNHGVKQLDLWTIWKQGWVMATRQINFYESVSNAYKEFPDKRYYGIYQGVTPTLLIKDPELIKELTVKSFEHFEDHWAFIDPESDPLWGNNVFALKGQKWRHMRNMLSPSFTSSKMRVIFQLISEASEDFVKYFLSKEETLIEVDMKNICSRFSNDVIATTAFGIKVNSLRDPNNEFYAMGKQLTSFGGVRNAFKFLGFFFVPKIFKLFKIRFLDKTAGDFLENLIYESINARKANKIVRPDMINLLLEVQRGIGKPEEAIPAETNSSATKDEDYNTNGKQKITDADIASQALIFFFAGFDTVSTVMCFIAYELALHLDVQEKIRNEINEASERCNGQITYEALLGMKYFDMVISECLRMWPPVPGVDRVCTKPYVIRASSPEEKDVSIEKGTVIMIPSYGIQRDPRHFDNPDEFNPERFSDENKNNIKPYTYGPFGYGPRMCLGSRFALMELKTLLFHLLTHFEIVPSSKLRVPLRFDKKSLNVAIEGGFWFNLRRIKHNH